MLKPWMLLALLGLLCPAPFMVLLWVSPGLCHLLTPFCMLLIMVSLLWLPPRLQLLPMVCLKPRLPGTRRCSKKALIVHSRWLLVLLGLPVMVPHPRMVVLPHPLPLPSFPVTVVLVAVCNGDGLESR